MTKTFLLVAAFTLLVCSVDAFSTVTRWNPIVLRTRALVRVDAKINDEEGHEITRRQALSIGLATATVMPAIAANAAGSDYTPARRPFAYRIDSTIPPTLLPLNARQEQSALKAIGKGSGTKKAGVVEDRINLNNMMNKGVFGAIGAVQSVLGTNAVDLETRGPGFATFLAMGVPKDASEEDIGLATSMLTFVMQGRGKKASTGLGVAFAPLSTQPALQSFQSSGDFEALSASLMEAGVSESTINLYKPLLEFARSKSMDLIAMSPEVEDIKTVRATGLQNVDQDRRATYVADAEGFVALTQDPKFRLFADRSLLKDFEPSGKDDQPGNFFAERILVHETGATAVARYATTRPESFVAFVAPIPDVRFVGGYNGRLPRICQFMNQEQNKVNDNCVTTVLLNPTAKETLSLSRYLRLEIGTAPTNIDYQTKIADYLWFSKMPKVNMIPRLMNA